MTDYILVALGAYATVSITGKDNSRRTKEMQKILNGICNRPLELPDEVYRYFKCTINHSSKITECCTEACILKTSILKRRIQIASQLMTTASINFLYSLDIEVLRKYKQCIKYSAVIHNTNFIMYLHNNNILEMTRMCIAAAKQKNIHCLKFIIDLDSGMTIDVDRIAKTAAVYGNIEALQIMMEHDPFVIYNIKLSDCAAACKTVEVLKFLKMNGAKLRQSSIWISIHYNNYDNLLYLMKYHSLDSIGWLDIYNAMSLGNLQIIKYLSTIANITDHSHITAAIQNDRSHVLEYLNSIGIIFSDLCLCDAARYGINCFIYLYNIEYLQKYIGPILYKHAIMGNNIKVLRFLFDNSVEFLDMDTYNELANRVHKNTIMFIQKRIQN